MPNTNLCVLLICVVTFQALVVEAQLDGTCAGAAGACSNEPNAFKCDSATPPKCLCNINYVLSDADCALITCNTPVDDCGANTACTKDTSKCSCLANFETVVATPTLCTQIPCTDDTMNLCTDEDTNSYCLSDECVCKTNFNGAALANCERKTCLNDATCLEANSACHTVANPGCGCNTLYTADVTTGACSTQKTCVADTTVTATCGTNTVCDLSLNAYLCFCQANYEASATGCVVKTCSAVDECGTGDFQCTSSGQCACAADFTPSGSICKRACPSGASACHTTFATCVNGVCECNVNYEGDGETCTPRACTAGVVTNCHPNSQCDTTGSNPVCACASGWVIDGTACKESCTTTNAGTTCDANASCLSLKCECNVNYIGDGNTCTQRTCSGTETTNCDPNSQCLSDKCSCAENFVVNGQACECPSGFTVVGSLCKKSCTDNTGCGTNGACANSSCECEPNFMGNAATACTQIACNGTDTTTCVADSTCSSDKCVCTAGSSKIESDQLVCGCEGIFCNFALLMVSLLMVFFTSKRFE